MKMLMKRGMALLMALVLIVGFVPATAFTAAASTVEYKYDGSYIYNWGTRGTVATFLSPNAEDFYEENNVSYYELAAMSGSATESSVPSSALYKELQSIMSEAHKTETSYDGTRDLFQYTDCQKNGSPTTISAFYSGNPVGPAWDGGSTWNREHTWPNSKGDMAGNGENDIMMLRPAAKSVNSSRGNDAYGESADYYNPNSVSEGAYDIRGDVARIILYVYVRWGCTNTGADYNPDGIFGIDGVIESKERLLDWMEADPVDTWEMGRNDSVESITGTRNIFVDYPELAFELFEEEVPADMQTPSAGTKADSVYTVNFSGAVDVSSQTVDTGKSITLPVVTAPDGYTFLGWMETELTEDTTEKPSYHTGAYTPTASVTLYALYSYMAGGGVAGSGEYVKVTTAPDDWSGEYLIVYEAGKVIFDGSLTSFDAVGNNRSVTITDGAISAETADAYQFIIAPMDGGGYSIKGASGKYIGNSANSNALTTGSDAMKNTLSIDGSGNANIVGAGGAYLRYNSASNQNRFRYYKSSSYTGQKPIALYKKENVSSSVLTYTGNPLKCEHTSIVAIGKAVEPTCSTTGMTAGEKCADCGKVFTVQQSIPKKEHTYTSVVTQPTCTEDGYTTYTCSVCTHSYMANSVPATGHNYVGGTCACGAEEPVAGETEERTYVFADYNAGTQYADDEEHVLDNDVTMITTDSHFTSELRIYSSTTYNGFAIINSALPISSMKMNAGNNADSLAIYGSNDGGVTWTEIATQAVTSNYTDYTIEFNGSIYKSLKLDVVGTKQVRLQNITLTLVTGGSGSGETPCEHSNRVAVGEAVEAGCTTPGMTAGEKCADCGEILIAREEIPAAGHNYADGVCTVCGVSSSSDLSGDYYIAAIRTSGNYWYMTNSLGTASTKRYQAVDSGVTVLPAEITTVAEANVFTLELQSDGKYKIKATHIEGDNYLGWTTGNSGLLVAEESALALNLKASKTKNAYNVTYNDRYLSLNASTGSNYFAFYGGTQVNDLYLVPVHASEVCSHTNKVPVGEAVAATCTTPGTTAGEKCADCGEILTAQEEIPATGHNFDAGVCTNCGATETNVVIPSYPESGIYQLVTDIAEVKNGGKFVIVANVNGTYYAMGTTFTNNKLNSVEIDVINDLVYTADAPTWIVGAYGESVAITDGTEYLKHSSSTNFSTVSEVFPWSVVVADSGNGWNLISSTDAERALTLRVGSNNIFGVYALSNNNDGEYYCDLQIYELVEGELPQTQSTLSFSENSNVAFTVNAEVGSQYTMPNASVVAPEGYTFAGWVEQQQLDETSIMPGNILIAGNQYTVGKNVTFYALYTRTETVESGKSYQLVTDASTLAAGDKIVIAASEYTYAISTTQNKNNRGQAIIVKNGTTITFGDDVQVLTLETGNVTGTFAFNTGSGYLYAASSSGNYLRTKTALDDNGSWKITITNGTTSVVAQGTNTRNVMQYNQGSSLFACYGSASQKAVALYKETVDTTETAYYTTCTHNWVDATCTAPKTCLICGKTEGEALGHTEETIPAVEATNDTHGWTEGTRCTVCGEDVNKPTKIPCLVGTMESWNITLRENIGVNFHLFVNESIREDAQISITFYGKTETFAASQFPYDEENDVFIVTVDAAAAQMMDDIVVQITDGEGNTVTKTRTIRQYADYILDPENGYDEKTKTVVREMLNYGAKAQTYFEYNEGNPANKDISGVGTQAVPENAPLDKDISGSTDGITFYGATLVFRNKIALRYYFVPEDVNAEYTFTVGGVPYTPKSKQGLLYIEIPGITPEHLDKQYQVNVKTIGGEGTLTVAYGPMNYLVNMNSKGNDAMKALVKALYNYHLAAEVLSPDNT